MAAEKSLIIDTEKFSYVVNKLRTFFLNKGFLECHTQNRLSILAACEDPANLSEFEYDNRVWPLPQTGQMWLEYELLTNPKYNGYFCVSTSYRYEPNPIKGRHDIIFPMFEFELKGNMDKLEILERELLEYLGYGDMCNFPSGDYEEVANNYKTLDISHKEEQRLYEEKGPVFFLKNFPEYTSPFWNMARYEDKPIAKKIDVILSGMETIGSAERSVDVSDMLNRFKTISDGKYAELLYNKFSEERVNNELNEFLNHKFITRSGGGIGLTRLISSMTKEGLIPDFESNQ